MYSLRTQHAEARWLQRTVREYWHRMTEREGRKCMAAEAARTQGSVKGSELTTSTGQSVSLNGKQST